MREESCQLFAALHLPLPLPLCIIVIAPTSSVNWFSFRLFCLQLGSQQTRQLPYLLLFLLSHCAASFIFPPCFLYLSTLLCNWLEWLSTDQATNERIETNPRDEKQKEVKMERRGEGRGMENETNRFTNGLLFRIISCCAL